MTTQKFLKEAKSTLTVNGSRFNIQINDNGIVVRVEYLSLISCDSGKMIKKWNNSFELTIVPHMLIKEVLNKIEKFGEMYDVELKNKMTFVSDFIINNIENELEDVEETNNLH